MRRHSRFEPIEHKLNSVSAQFAGRATWTDEHLNTSGNMLSHCD